MLPTAMGLLPWAPRLPARGEESYPPLGEPEGREGRWAQIGNATVRDSVRGRAP